jgi:hypothetical protein
VPGADKTAREAEHTIRVEDHIVEVAHWAAAGFGNREETVAAVRSRAGQGRAPAMGFVLALAEILLKLRALESQVAFRVA